MSRHDHDPSIEFEPHMQNGPMKIDPSEEPAEAKVRAELVRERPHDLVEHTVWDEPALSAGLAGDPPADQLTYARWLDGKIAATSWAASWAVALALVLVAGPWGVLGALFGGGSGDLTTAALVTVVLFAPATEEIAKIAATLWVIEKRPYLFKSMGQVLLCAAAGGFVFGVIENLLYLHVYIPEAAAPLVRWRWTVCTGLHVTCSFLAGVGLVRIWDNAIRNRHRPQLGLGMPWIFTAMVGHGLYNLTVSLVPASSMF